MTLEERAFRKAMRRLIPFLFLIYVVAYLDRVNVSFAQLQLEDDLDFTDTIFGIGAGIFSLGYVIFGVPSNLALARFGARRWLAAIMIVWGLISASMMFIESAAGFYVLRFLLGAAEAGFFPGIILFLTWWFPERRRTPALALFLTAVSAAYVFGGPVSGGLLELDNFAGLDGLAVAVPARGTARDRARLRHARAISTSARATPPGSSPTSAISWWPRSSASTSCARGSAASGSATRSAAAAFGRSDSSTSSLLAAGFGLTFFVPDLVQDRTGYTDFEVGVLAAIPFGFATAR